MPARWAVSLVLHLHRLHDADHGAGLDDSPSATSTARTVPCIGVTIASRPPAPAPRELSSRRRRASSRTAAPGVRTVDLEAAAVDLDLVSAARDEPARPRHACCQMSSSDTAPRVLARGSSSDSTTPGRSLPREARMLEQRAVEADERLHPADLELAERAKHPAPRVLAVDVADDQLRDHRVVERRGPRCPPSPPSRPARPARPAPGSS